MSAVLGVIGGSGLYQMPGLTEVEDVRVETPFGAPSDAIVRGRLGDTTLLFLPRHGRLHQHSPSKVNYRANIWALKSLGATHVLSVSAVGSLREEVAPGHVVVPDQFIDRTAGRVSTFFDDGVVAHVSMADPVCPRLAAALAAAAKTTGATVHVGGTYVCIEGPRFSTRAESHLFRQWGATVIGMTNVPEAFLAREAELPYATMALSTDYDCWRPHEEVDVNDILAVLHANVSRAQEVVRALASTLPDPSDSPAAGALQYAVLTKPSALTPALRERYALLLGRYW
ncbi:MAG: S-methyl-5'-thioadenosine phosphorylase [Polyangiales bacterium]